MHPDFSELRRLYLEGKNITDFLRKTECSGINTTKIIEVAYDLQAGSYIDFSKQNSAFVSKYASIISGKMRPWLSPSDFVLDVGTGEMTTYGPVMNQLDYAAGFACDLSLSRLLAGRNWLKKHYPSVHKTLRPFVADLAALPLSDAAVDVTWSSHALEPNHGREKLLMAELLRVTRKILILFEPHYESASTEAQQRMRRLGYVRNLEASIKECGGELLELVKLPVVSNPLNHTHCFIVKPTQHNNTAQTANAELQFVCPGGKEHLDLVADGCILSSTGLLAYPLVSGIPLLRSHLAFPFTHPELIASIPTRNDLA